MSYFKYQEYTIISLFFILAFMLYFYYYTQKETFSSTRNSTSLEDLDIYDKFYASIYDKLFAGEDRCSFELEQIKQITMTKFPKKSTKVLDVGCGTGAYSKPMTDIGVAYTGVDQSAAMLDKARSKNPIATFKRGDILQPTLFAPKSFTHVFCMYYMIYGVDSPEQLVFNAQLWLKPQGYFIVHMVNPDKFDPILDPASPFPAFSLQKYSSKRITESEVDFDNFKYKARFTKKPVEENAVFEEVFFFPKTKQKRIHRHNLTMPPLESLQNMIEDAGFHLTKIIDLVACAYEYNYLYIFQK